MHSCDPHIAWYSILVEYMWMIFFLGTFKDFTNWLWMVSLISYSMYFIWSGHEEDSWQNQTGLPRPSHHTFNEYVTKIRRLHMGCNTPSRLFIPTVLPYLKEGESLYHTIQPYEDVRLDTSWTRSGGDKLPARIGCLCLVVGTSPERDTAVSKTNSIRCSPCLPFQTHKYDHCCYHY